MKLLFERSRKGRSAVIVPPLDVNEYRLPDGLAREKTPRLPEISEVDLSRHYTELMKQVHGVNDGAYPLGSCTMKYNPKVDEEIAALALFTDIHPLQDLSTVQGSLEVMYRTKRLLCELTGMEDMTLQPAAGAHGEYTGLLLIRKYHLDRNDLKRKNIIVPDSAHGTNPASASMAGFRVINVKSNEEGGIDLDELKKAVNDETAGLMLTNPNTLGIFDRNILEVTKIIHEAGGLCYYDGANMNAIVGRIKPGDMGFDCIHLNLHKTFATPHGGGGPGSGPVGCKGFLAGYLPKPIVTEIDGVYGFETPEKTMGQVRSFYGNFLVVVKALTYIMSLGREGLLEASSVAVLNANYMMHRLKEYYGMASGKICMHEFVMDLDELKKETGVNAMDIAKASLDFGVHPPTMYFPLIVHEALMVEPTETESRESLDALTDIFVKLAEKAHEDPEYLHNAPYTTMIGRPDEARAARTPVIRYDFED